MAQIQLVEATDFHVEKDVFKAPMPAMHYHPTHELYYLVKGEREYFVDDRFFKVEEGDLVFVPRNMLHRTAGKGASRYLVYFSNAFLQKFFTAHTLEALLPKEPLVFRPDEGERAQLEQTLATLCVEYNRAEPHVTPKNEQVLAGLLHRVLFTMGCTSNTYVPHSYADARVAQIIKYINENFSHITDIEEIAAHFFISKYHLCRIFNKNLGIPLVTYLNNIKIREACRLIKRGELNLTEIAMRCGFNSSSYFCKVFKGEKGVSPTEYRKNHK